MSRCYFDALSGQPLAEPAQSAISGFISRIWADPDQPHHEGAQAGQVLQAARETVALRLGVSPGAVSFHSASDVAQLAVSGILRSVGQRAPGDQQRIVTSTVERDVVMQSTAAFGSVRRLGVDSEARLRLDDFRATITSDNDPASCVVLQAANTEVGTLQPLLEVFSLASAAGVPVAVDATGALGLLPIPSGWSALIADASTWAGPRGTSVLVVNPEFRWYRTDFDRGAASLIHDTVDVLNATAAAAALDATCGQQPQLSAALYEWTRQIRSFVSEHIADVDVLGDPDERLPHVVTFSFLYADGERLARELDAAGVAVGSGSACAARAGLPSHVLTEMGALTHGNIRLSLPVTTTERHVEHLLAVLPDAVSRVRAEAGM